MANENTAPQGSEQADTSLDFEDALALMPDEESPEGIDPAPKPKAATSETPDDEEDKHPEDADEENVEAAAEDEAAQEIKDEVFVAFEDGTKASIAELKHAYKEVAEVKANTTRKLQEVASERGNLQTLGANMAKALENVSNYLVSKLPPEPDENLLFTDPAAFQRATIFRNRAINELQDMLQVAEGTKQATEFLSDADFKALKADEDQKLIEALPNLKDPKRFSAAEAKLKAYAKSIGFADNEIDTTADHRIRRMAIDAAYGREARAAAAKAKGKVEVASPMLPAKQRQHPNSKQALDQVNAVKRLQKSGSIDDALKLNW